MAKGKKKAQRPAAVVKRTAARVHNSSKRKMHDGRSRYPIIEPLREWMRAYGYGTDGALARKEFAERLNTSVQYLSQIGLGYRKASMEMAIAIDKQTHGLVPAEAILPDADWAYLKARAERSALQAERLKTLSPRQAAARASALAP